MSNQNIYITDSIEPFYFDEKPTQDSFHQIIEDGKVAGVVFNYHDFLFEIKKDTEVGGYYLYVDSDIYSDGTIRLLAGKYIVNLNAFKRNVEITFDKFFVPISVRYSKKLIHSTIQCNSFFIDN